MATYKSDIITAKDSLDISSKSLSGEKTGAQILYATAEYACGNIAGDSNDIIELADIPAGATVVPELSYVAKSFGYRNVRVSLGDETGTGRFGLVGTPETGVPAGLSSFGYDAPSHGIFGLGATGVPAPYTKETRVLAHMLNGSEALLPNSKLTFGIAYRVQG